MNKVAIIKKKLTKTITAVLLVLQFVFAIPIFTPQQAHAITISPDKYFFTSSAGKVVSDKLVLMARPDTIPNSKLYIAAVSAKIIEENSDRQFTFPNKDERLDPANWVEFSQTEIIVNPGNDYNINWSATIPQGATCGTNVLGIAVMDSPINPQDEGAVVGINKNIISQVHIDVQNDGTSACPDNAVRYELVDFKVDATIPVFNYDEIPFKTLLKNRGNLIGVDPMGFIEITGLGEKISVPFNAEKLDVYPGATREFTNLWIDENYPKDGDFWEKLAYEIGHLKIGQYNVQLGITKNCDPQIISTTTLWIMPWRVILAFVVFVVVVVFLTKLPDIINAIKGDKRRK